MDPLSGLLQGFSTALTLGNLFNCFLGCFLGTLTGVLPGFGPGAAVALLLPMTLYLSPASAIIMLAGIYYGAMYGGSTTSILVNIPGEAASVVTCFDGYKMALQGRAGSCTWDCRLRILYRRHHQYYRTDVCRPPPCKVCPGVYFRGVRIHHLFRIDAPLFFRLRIQDQGLYDGRGRHSGGSRWDGSGRQ